MDSWYGHAVSRQKREKRTRSVVYAAHCRNFIEDCERNQITEKMKSGYEESYGCRPGESEIQSWKNSLRALALVLLRTRSNRPANTARIQTTVDLETSRLHFVRLRRRRIVVVDRHRGGTPRHRAKVGACASGLTLPLRGLAPATKVGSPTSNVFIYCRSRAGHQPRVSTNLDGRARPRDQTHTSRYRSGFAPADVKPGTLSVKLLRHN